MSNVHEVAPRLIKRDCGGWLAVSPPGAALSLGVTAATEADAVAKFRAAETRWLTILASDHPPGAVVR